MLPNTSRTHKLKEYFMDLWYDQYVLQSSLKGWSGMSGENAILLVSERVVLDQVMVQQIGLALREWMVFEVFEVEEFETPPGSAEMYARGGPVACVVTVIGLQLHTVPAFLSVGTSQPTELRPEGFYNFPLGGATVLLAGPRVVGFATTRADGVVLTVVFRKRSGT
jgi:hypothetical protein